MTIPVAVRRSQYAVFVVAAIHIVAIALILMHRDDLHPGPNDDVNGLLLQSLVPHVILAILLPLRALRLARGRRKSRTVLTVVLAVQILAHATLPMVMRELPGYGGWIIAVQAVSFVFEVAALAYLWSPAARAFFRPAASVPVPDRAMVH
jgi:hypothetical protein